MFICDPTLKDFLTSQPAAAAFLRLLEGFLVGKDANECRCLIEDYAVGGGDGGITRQVMRVACGLAPVGKGHAGASQVTSRTPPPATDGTGTIGGLPGPLAPVGCLLPPPMETCAVSHGRSRDPWEVPGRPMGGPPTSHSKYLKQNKCFKPLSNQL